MGLDLQMLPIESESGNYGYSHTVLNCERREELFQKILELKTHPVPASFNTYVSRDEKYEASHYGNTQGTPYGDPLGWVDVSELLAFSDHRDVRDNHLNRAVWAYLEELEPMTKVALYWH